MFVEIFISLLIYRLLTFLFFFNINEVHMCEIFSLKSSDQITNMRLVWVVDCSSDHFLAVELKVEIKSRLENYGEIWQYIAIILDVFLH